MRLLKFSIWLSYVFSLSLAYALTLSDIRTEIRKAVHDNPSDTARRRYSDTDLLNLANQGQRETVNLTGLAEKTTAYVLSRNATYYFLPTDLLYIQQVYFTDKTGQTIELEELAQRSLYDQNPNWERNTGSPSSYWVSNSTLPQNQTSARLRISYIPIPTQTSTGTVLIWYTSTVADLSADADVPWDNRVHLTAYHYALVYYVVFRIKVIESKADEAGAYQTLYANSVALMKSNLGMMPNYNPGANIPSTR